MVNLALAPSMYELTEDNTMVGKHQVPLSMDQIIRHWAEAVPLEEVPLDPFPYAKSWDEKYKPLHQT